MSMTPESITMVLTGAGVYFGIRHLLEGFRLDISDQLSAINNKIDNVLSGRPR